MKKLLFGFCSAACLSACVMSSVVPLQVNSTPPGARIYVNHISVGIAPLQVKLACDKRWICPADAPCAWQYDDEDVDEVTAYPPEDNAGPSQTKRVNACQQTNSSANIIFDFGPGAAEPRQSTDVNVNQEDKTTAP
jgi:hypothetical protein